MAASELRQRIASPMGRERKGVGRSKDRLITLNWCAASDRLRVCDSPVVWCRAQDCSNILCTSLHLAGDKWGCIRACFPCWWETRVRQFWIPGAQKEGSKATLWCLKWFRSFNQSVSTLILTRPLPRRQLKGYFTTAHATDDNCWSTLSGRRFSWSCLQGASRSDKITAF